jgi:hypothetical protein
VTIEQAIQKAIEGWWNSEECAPPVGSRDRFNIERMLLDPSFWQSLGKSMGWEKKTCKFCGCTESKGYIDHDTGEHDAECKGCGANWMDANEFPEKGNVIDTWLHRWHRLIEHLAEGSTIESYFEEIE